MVLVLTQLAEAQLTRTNSGRERRGKQEQMAIAARLKEYQCLEELWEQSGRGWRGAGYPEASALGELATGSGEDTEEALTVTSCSTHSFGFKRDPRKTPPHKLIILGRDGEYLPGKVFQ